jgi:hypothetical protein
LRRKKDKEKIEVKVIRMRSSPSQQEDCSTKREQKAYDEKTYV